jgi:hypothetical protein
MKQSMNSKFQPPAMFVFLVYRKNGLSKSYLFLEYPPEYKVNNPKLTDGFAPTSQV